MIAKQTKNEKNKEALKAEVDKFMSKKGRSGLPSIHSKTEPN